ncbi:hypothetical protein BD769DRAFT_1440844 [Suillus cothurnatus]|nr:hypothetical protein BD769DRAFT_1440844 [Suillus cothurnatus]
MESTIFEFLRTSDNQCAFIFKHQCRGTSHVYIQSGQETNAALETGDDSRVYTQLPSIIATASDAENSPVQATHIISRQDALLVQSMKRVKHLFRTESSTSSRNNDFEETSSRCKHAFFNNLSSSSCLRAVFSSAANSTAVCRTEECRIDSSRVLRVHFSAYGSLNSAIAH